MPMSRVTEDVRQKRLEDLIASCGQQIGDHTVMVFENDESKSRPFSLWGRDGVPYSRIWFNGFEREGWLRREGVGHSTMIDGGRPFKGTSFTLTEDGQEMLDIRRDLLPL